MTIGNGGIIGKKNTVNNTVATGIFTLDEQSEYSRISAWPQVINVSVAPNVTVVNEGGTVTFNVIASGIPNGTTLYWTTNVVSGTLNSADFTSGTLSGSFAVNGGVAQITRSIAIDAVTPETGEAFSLSIRSGSTSGPILATSVPVTISNATFNIQASATTIDESSTTVIRFDFTSSGIDVGQTIYYELVSATGTIDSSDFLVQVTGTFQIIDGVMTLIFTTRADQVTEGSESFFLRLRYLNASGAILGTSATVNITDSSVNPTLTFTALTTTINEGVANNINVSASPTYTSPISLYWEIINITGTLNFSATNGTISNFVSTGSFTVTALTSGSGGTYQIRLRNGGASGSILATSDTVTVNNVAASVSAMSFITSTTSTAATIVIPATAQIGDIAVLFDAPLSSPGGTITQVTPTGFTTISSTQFKGSESVDYRSTISFKRLVSGDPGSTITGQNTTTNRKLLVIFRPDAPIVSQVVSTPVAQGTANVPTNQTIVMSGQVTPMIGFASYRSAGAITTRGSSVTMNEIQGVNTGHFIKYIIYNSGNTPQNITISMSDNGVTNILQSFFIRFT